MVNITIADIIAYLQTMSPDTPVLLDKNGWPDDGENTPYKTIYRSGLFYHLDESKFGGSSSLIINN